MYGYDYECGLKTMLDLQLLVTVPILCTKRTLRLFLVMIIGILFELVGNCYLYLPLLQI